MLKAFDGWYHDLPYSHNHKYLLIEDIMTAEEENFDELVFFNQIVYLQHFYVDNIQHYHLVK